MMSGIKRLQKQAKTGKKWCRDCVHYSEAEFLAFTIEPNDVADKCPDYVQKEGKRWFE